MKHQLVTHVPAGDAQMYLKDPNWVAQPKYDGVRLLAFCQRAFRTITRSGKYHKVLDDGVLQELCDLPSCVLDGELVGNKFYIFDILQDGKTDMRSSSYSNRLAAARSLLFHNKQVVLAETTWLERTKSQMWKRLQKQNAEGIVFHNLNAKYLDGKRSLDIVAVKFKAKTIVRALDYRMTKRRGKLKYGSVSLYDAHGIFVGHCNVPPNYDTETFNCIEPNVSVEYLYFVDHLVQPVLLGATHHPVHRLKTFKRRNK